MSRYQAKEKLRQIYQREDNSNKTFIPAKPKVDLYGGEHIFRVCAYCRVSTDDIDQAISIELQMRQYKEKIKATPHNCQK